MSENSELFDITIIGGGVIGLSIANQLSSKKLKILLLEKEKNVGLINSSRNTEVIHAGIYYKYNSLKAKLSLRGKKLLYAFCEKYKIKYKKIGKFIIQANENINNNNELDQIFNLGLKNGVNDLKFIDKNQLSRYEPNLLKCDAIFSPSSGIIDTKGFIDILEVLTIENNVIIAKNSCFNEATYKNKTWFLTINNEIKFKIKSKIIINCAGLNSLEISNKHFKNDLLTAKPTKGSYLRYIDKCPFNSIIYPAFTPGFIQERVDATPDLWGGLRFGPSVDKTNSIYDFNTPIDLIDRLYNSIKIYFPKINKEKINLDIAGIRPKIISNNSQNMDYIFDIKNHSWIDLFGIESPGLTASLAIAEYVEEKVEMII